MGASTSIWIVDDKSDNFDVIEILLFRENYDLQYFPSGAAVLAQLETSQPHVILLDVMMPDMDGLEVCRRIKAHPTWQHIPIIMVTALNSKDDLAQCLEAGADDFVSKPVNGVELRARIRSMLRIKYQYEDLQALLQLREDMVYMIVHDLRNPLANVVLSCELLRMMELEEKPMRKVHQISVASQQLQSLIDSLLTMAKLESGKLVLDRTEVDLHQVGKSVLRDFEVIAAQKQIELVGVLPEAGGGVRVDAAIFRRILDNLLSNALKFSPSKSQVVLQIEYLQFGKARVAVADAGAGVNEEMRQRIFERYEIGNMAVGVPQIGLGLAFCKIAIEAHGGQITVSDNTPRGSVFTIEV
ncbi:MAG: hybrid sensor histidine kinase/response regulator [Leptolyngbyaceae cyanobacterium bins.59]|nr:hybrid sensor histidine kinase/response regulator [Leptolyngbyaceae cyanobacterium bins.59]